VMLMTSDRLAVTHRIEIPPEQQLQSQTRPASEGGRYNSYVWKKLYLT